jgi:hypothetical protein
MDTQKIFIGDKSQAVIRCSNCGKTKTVDVESIRHIRKPIRVKCGCACVFNVVLEERKYYRKETTLSGVCSKGGQNGSPFPITVENLSRSGVGFVVYDKGVTVNGIQQNDTLNIEFRLDNKTKALIRSKIIVRFIRDNYVGAEFCCLDEHAKKELGFYLMP